ncbi:MAG: SEC-C domain-containing protein [Planctomycetes bacterium]|nr:SEC-C domain-containing protein [Planctomycetota bacterium]
MTTPPPAYAAEELSGLAAPRLLDLLRGDEDRVPRNVIEECARRGDEMVRAFQEIARDERFWREGAPLGEWWLRLHAVMILGLVPSEDAGLLLVSLMRRMERAEDENLQDWLSGYWPALFRDKPAAVLAALRELARDRRIDWYMRIQAIEAVVAAGERDGAGALDAALDWGAAMAADGSDDSTLRFAAGGKLLDFPRERHRPLLERLAEEQKGPFAHFGAGDVKRAYARAGDARRRERFDDPWRFYSPASIAERQERWAKDDADEPEEADDAFPFDDAAAPDELFSLDDVPGPYMRDAPKVGRNDPCPCGSGRKYKRCCLNKAEAEPLESLAWRRLRRLLDEHQRDMLRFATNTYGPGAIEEAWRSFVSDSEAAFDPQTRHLQLFMAWFYHRWSPPAETTSVRDQALCGVTPTAEYLRRKKRLDPLLREYLESCLASPFSAFEILGVDPGRGMRVKDLFTGAEHDVSERSASATMRTADLLIGQLAGAGGVTLLEAAPGFAIPPIWKIKAIEFRHERFGGAINAAPERLRKAEDALIALYHDISEEVFARKLPAMQNTDGEALSPRRVVFDVPSAQQAFDALKHLALSDSEPELLRDAGRDAAGSLSRVKLNWLEQGNAQMPAWENTVLGSIEIDGTRLIAEVNSEERERRFREIVAAALGGRARHRATEIQSLERMLAQAPAGSDSKDPERLAELPEVKAKIAEMMAKHYERWVDEKIPALGGRTPLEAVRDSAGREAVQALVAQIERDGGRMKPPLDPEIPRRLRERLGLGSSKP